MVTLYDHELSADCYKLRLLLSILRVGYDTVPIDIFPGEEHREAWFLALNPLGEVPVLADDALTITDAEAGLVYLARRYDAAASWFPVDDPALSAEILGWHGFARRLAATVSVARAAIAMGADADLPAAQAGAHRLMRVLDEHLWFGERTGRSWLASAAEPTVADIAVFPDTVLCEEGGISRQDYPAIRRWLDRVKRIPGFTVMSGVFPTAPARM